MASASVVRIPCRCMSQFTRQRRSRELVDRIIRVDHAGELGADRIYEGQLAVLGKTPVGPVIKVSKITKLASETPDHGMMSHNLNPNEWYKSRSSWHD